MAEDEDETAEEYYEDEDEMVEGVGYSSRRTRSPKKRTCCNQRIDELSTPHKRMFLALWNEHAYHLPKDKVKNLKMLLQQLYAMSPEETAKYFAELRAEVKAATIRRRMKQKLRKYLTDKHNLKQRQRAYKLFKRLLKCGIAYAARNPVPPLVSVRLRYLSDIILEQLCDLRSVEIPNRSNPDQLGIFLIAVADWMAIAVERLYFAAQLSINEMTAVDEDSTVIIDDDSLGMPKSYQDFGPPAASSTPQRLSLDSQNKTMKIPSKYEDMGQPFGASTPQKLSLDLTAKETLKAGSRQSLNPYYSFVDTKPPNTSIKKKKKSQTKAPFYTFKHMKKTENAPSCFEKSALEIPPYTFTRRHRQTSSNKDVHGSVDETFRNSTLYSTARNNTTQRKY